jgi:chromosome segregation ATPase
MLYLTILLAIGVLVGPSSSSGPLPLPKGWKVAAAADGREYFYNVNTKETSWTPPVVESSSTAKLSPKSKAYVPTRRVPVITKASASAGSKSNMKQKEQEEQEQQQQQQQQQQQHDLSNMVPALEKQVGELTALLNVSQAECSSLLCALEEGAAEQARLQAQHKKLKSNSSKALTRAQDAETDVRSLLTELEARESELRDVFTRTVLPIETAGAAAVRSVSAAISCTSSSMLKAVSTLRSPVETPTPYPYGKIKRMKAAIVDLRGNVTMLGEVVEERDAFIERLTAEVEQCRTEQALLKETQHSVARESASQLAAARAAQSTAQTAADNALLTMRMDVKGLQDIIRAKDVAIKQRDDRLVELDEVCGNLESELRRIRRVTVELEGSLQTLDSELQKPWWALVYKRILQFFKKGKGLE